MVRKEAPAFRHGEDVTVEASEERKIRSNVEKGKFTLTVRIAGHAGPGETYAQAAARLRKIAQDEVGHP
jgi:hypothetical protein